MFNAVLSPQLAPDVSRHIHREQLMLHVETVQSVYVRYSPAQIPREF